MREPPFRHEVVRLDGSVDVFAVNSDGHSHQHLLRSISRLAANLQQVRPLERLKNKTKSTCDLKSSNSYGSDDQSHLESEVVVAIVAIVDDCRVKSVSVRHDDVIRLIGKHGGRFLGARVHVLEQVGHHL